MPTLRARIRDVAVWTSTSLGVAGASRALLKRAIRPTYIRAVNYHDIAPGDGPAFRRQMAWFSRHFAFAGSRDLEAVLSGSGPLDRPLLLVSFDDGLRGHYETAAPILAEFGASGWFMVPSGFVDCPPAEQTSFAELHSIRSSGRPAGDRLAMSWAELRDLLGRGHVIGSHTANHVRLVEGLDGATLTAEVVDSKRRLEAMLQQEVEHFCWVGGERTSYSRSAAAAVRAAGYRYAFMTNSAPIRQGSNPLALQRSNVEAAFPLRRVDFSTSGLADAIYAVKRRRVNAVVLPVD